MMSKIFSRSFAEFVGTALLVTVVVGSGIMGTNLSTDDGIALLINAFSTIFALAILILVLGPVSGAHLNPVVSLVQLITHTQRVSEIAGYLIAQITGAITGAILANLMFDLPAIEFSTHARATTGTLIGEVIATAGLIGLIGILVAREQARYLPAAVAAWIGSAYFFTSSTSFANPAVTIGRMFSDTFAGIEPGSVLPYIGAQLVGAAIGVVIIKTQTIK